MKNSLEIFLPLDPQGLPTAQQKGAMFKGGHIVFYEKSKVKSARNAIVGLLLANFDGEVVEHDAYSVTILYVYRPASIRKRDYGQPKITRPDVDNLTKLVLDAISDSHIAWKDDGQVSTLILRKRYAHADEEPYIYILIEQDRMPSSVLQAD